MKDLSNDKNASFVAMRFIKKCKTLQWIIVAAFILGIAGAISSVLVKRIIDSSIIVFLVWILSCINLWTTLQIIIKNWKKNRYGEKS